MLEKSSVLCLSSSAVFSSIGALGRIANAFIKTKWFISIYIWSFERLAWIIHQHIITPNCVPGSLPGLYMYDFPHTPLPLIRLLPLHK